MIAVAENPTDLETIVIGSALISENARDEAMELLAPRDFADPFHEEVWKIIGRMVAQGEPVDAYTVGDKLLATSYADRYSALVAYPERVATAANVGYYAEKVRLNGLRRRLKTISAMLVDLDADTESALAERALGLMDDALSSSRTPMEYVVDVMPRLVERMHGRAAYVRTDWPQVNELIGGLRPGALYVIGARPGQGKTIVAGQLAMTLAQHGHVAFSSLEMGADELVARFTAAQLGIFVGNITDAKMSPRDWALFEEHRARIEALNIAIDDRSGVTMTDVRRFVRGVRRNGHLSGLVVDYLQLMQSHERKERHLQVADFSRQLKILAKEFQIPVVALSQLNRNSERSEEAKPKLSDLRESGAIEQDADVVMLLRREATGIVEYGREREDFIVDIAKNRHGPVGEAILDWQGEHSRVVDPQAFA